MLDASYYASLGLADVLDKVLAGQRLSAEDGMALFACPDITAVGALAHHARCRMHGDKTSYVVNRQINYTNVCVNGCVFCAFRRDSEEDQGAFCLSTEEVLERLRAADATPLHLDELHIVGGCHPTRPFQWFLDTLRAARELNPGLLIKAFTPVEIAHFARMEGCSTLEVLQRLKDAGLVMMPGGGAEIFDEDLREQQDKSGGFTCFIPLPFLTENSRLKLPEEKLGPVRGLDQLRTVAVSRLMLDNIPHIKAYWIMMGTKLAQTALWYGADDLDGTVVEEHIGHMAGAGSAQGLTLKELEFMIREAGFTPVRRNAIFHTVPTEEARA